MQSIQRYKIDTLIALARMTEDAERKSRYLDEIEALLFDYTENATDAENSAYLGAEIVSADRFAGQANPSDVVGKTVRSVYDEYCSYCKENGYPATTLHTFGKRLRRIGGYRSESRKQKDGSMAKTYTSAFLPYVPNETNVPNENN